MLCAPGGALVVGADGPVQQVAIRRYVASKGKTGAFREHPQLSSRAVRMSACPKDLVSAPGECWATSAANAPGLPAFVLSGGGNLGALQVGMMYALVENGIRPGMIVGTSVGAINGAFFASHPDLPGIAEIARLWTSLRRKDVLGVDLGSLIGGFRGRPRHLFDSSSIRRILESFITFSRLEDAPIPLTVVATVLGTGEAVVLNSGDVATALLASSAVPRLLPPVEIGGRLLVDGAAAADVPLQQAVALGAREIYVLPTAPAQVAALIRQGATCDQAAGADRPIVHVIPPPVTRIPLARLDQSPALLRLGYDGARAWLEGEPRTSSVVDEPVLEIDRAPATRKRPASQNPVTATS
jgi:NTE family protein